MLSWLLSLSDGGVVVVVSVISVIFENIFTGVVVIVVLKTANAITEPITRATIIIGINNFRFFC